MEHEENKATDKQADDEKFFSTLLNMMTCVKELQELKSAQTHKQTEIDKERQLLFLILNLEKVNNSINKQCEANYEKLNIEKEKLDMTRLRLMELADECSQIDNRLENMFTNEDLEINSEEGMDVENKNCDLEENNDNDFQVNEFAEFYTKTKTEKEEMEKTVLKRQQRLAELNSELKKELIKMTPVQEDCNIPIEELRIEKKMANLLPNQLYFIYLHGKEFKKLSSDECGIKLDIVGDYDEGVEYKELPKLCDLRGDKKETEESVKMHERNKILEAHPLSISLCIYNKVGAELKIKFYYRPQLKFITVISTVDTLSNIPASSAREVLCGKSILNELYVGDCGIELPGFCNKFFLKKLNIESYQSLIPQLGHAYVWAQKLGGLDYLETSKMHKSEKYIKSVLTDIKRRFICRIGLATQLQQLEQNIIPATIPEDIDYPKTSFCKLTKFMSMTYEKCCEITPKALNLDMVNSQDFFYYLAISYQNAVLSASVIIKKDYPMISPMFLLFMDNGRKNAENFEHLRLMEEAINKEFVVQQEKSVWILSLRIRFLCLFFDMYLQRD